jgi:MFS family permease
VRNPHLPLAGTIAFGFVMTFSSGFGQTFFISLFNADIRTEFGLSHGEIGSLYSLATLLSAVTVIWSGKLLDTVDLRKYSLVVTLGLTVACLSISQATGPLTLAFSFYLLRLFGQGLSGHTGITTASRAPPAYRGRAISCAGLGFSTAEALLPLLIVIMVGLYGWRQVWQYAALAELLMIACIVQWLVWKFALAVKPSGPEHNTDDNSSWTLKHVYRDYRFWLIAPAIFSPSIVSTALFFHQQSLAEYKEIEFRVWASAIAAYSLAAVVASLVAGFAVDRWSGAKVVRFYLVPFCVAVLICAYSQWSILPVIYYALTGITIGVATPSVSALWLELYGSQHIAAIRSLAHALMVFGSALGPVIFGVLLDSGINWQQLLTGSAIWMIATSLLLIKVDLRWRSATA